MEKKRERERERERGAESDTFDASVSPFNHYYFQHRCLKLRSARVKKKKVTDN